MNLLESQNILLALLKFFGFFPIKFQGCRATKNLVYNLVVTIVMITSFAVIGTWQIDTVMENSTEKGSVVGFLVINIQMLSSIIGFAIIKLYLLARNDVLDKYAEKVQNLEQTVRVFSGRNSKIEKIIKDLRKSTLLREILFLILIILLLTGYIFCVTAENYIMFVADIIIYMSFNCFYMQILFFLKMNMKFVSRLQNHLNQALHHRQKFHTHFDVEEYIRIHLKIKMFLKTFNKDFGFIFFVIFLTISGGMIPEVYMGILSLVQLDLEISSHLFIYIMLNFIWATHSYYVLGQFAFACDEMEEEVCELLLCFYLTVFYHS
jgi:hypothetical protein